MKLEKTLKVIRQISSVSDSGPGINDAILVGDVELVVRVLKMEIRHLPDETLDPKLLLALSKLYQLVGDDHRALAVFERAAAFTDQNRGYYSDLGFCSMQLCRESTSEEFSLEVGNATERLLSVCPFREDLLKALGRTG